MSSRKSLSELLGSRLYTAASSMFNDLFERGESAVLIGGAASKIYIPSRETKDLDVNVRQERFLAIKSSISSDRFQLKPSTDQRKMSITYTTNDTKNSVKCDVSPMSAAFEQTVFKHTIRDKTSGIRYPTIQHLLALKIRGFVARHQGQDGKKFKDIEDIKELTSFIYTESSEKTMSEDLVRYYLRPGNVMGVFQGIVNKDYKEYKEHMDQFLYRIIPVVQDRGTNQTQDPAQRPPAAQGGQAQGPVQALKKSVDTPKKNTTTPPATASGTNSKKSKTVSTTGAAAGSSSGATAGNKPVSKKLVVGKPPPDKDKKAGKKKS